MPEPSIKTTVVGSYPVPSWLAALPSSASLRDAILVALKTRELVVTILGAGRYLFSRTP